MEKHIPYAKVETAGRIAVESLLTVTVGVLLGRLAWVALAPSEAASQTLNLASLESAETLPGPEAPAEQLLTRMNPFAADALVASPGAQVGGETTLDLKLSGVRSVTGNATASSAIVSFPDGAQKRFVPGDEVMPGVVLVNVTSDMIHLSRNGALETLSMYPGQHRPFEPRETSPAAGAVDVASSSETLQGNVTPAALASDTLLTPEFRSGVVSGYRLEPRGAGAFEAAGLQAGDLILRINGQAIEGQRPDQIYQSVSSGTDVALDVVRQGAIIRLRVAPAASLSQ